jgi:hypothetical protein
MVYALEYAHGCYLCAGTGTVVGDEQHPFTPLLHLSNCAQRATLTVRITDFVAPGLFSLGFDFGDLGGCDALLFTRAALAHSFKENVTRSLNQILSYHSS